MTMAGICKSRKELAFASQPKMLQTEIPVRRNVSNVSFDTCNGNDTIVKSANNLRASHDEQETKGVPHLNSYLIVPFLKVFHFTLLIPDGIQFDKGRCEFFQKKANIFVKILSYLWLICLGGYLLIIFLHDVGQTYTVKAIINKMTWACYTLFDITAIACLRTNGEKLAKILTEGNRLSHTMDQIWSDKEGKERKTSHLIKYIVWIICVISLIYTICFILFVIFELTAATTNLYSTFLNWTSTNGNDSFRCSPDDILCNLIERYTTSVLASSVLTFWFIMGFSVELIWVVYLMMTASCSVYFKRMFTDCICLIEKDYVRITEGLQIYSRISVILEDLNKIFGYTLLWIVIANILYLASSIGELWVVGFSGHVMFNAINVIGFIPFLLTIYCGSELHKMGLLLPSIIKRQFLQTKTGDNERNFEMLQGTAQIQYDILSNNIAMKGGDFFSISYGFVGSMVGAIITYSLVAVQLHEEM